MARTIKLKESDLTKIVRRISESKTLLNEKKKRWVWKAWVDDLIRVGNLISTILGWSDSRLKKNIRRVGKSPSGIPIYEFEYKNKVRFGGGTYRGVLAEHAPKKAVVIAENGYKKVDYSKIDVAFEKVNSKKRKTIRLKESDLTNVIKRVTNEKFYDDRSIDDILGGGGPGPFDPSPFDPFGDNNPFGGMSQGGGSDDPMARGNEEMETDNDTGRSGENDRYMKELMSLLPSLDEAAAFVQTLTPESLDKDYRPMGRLHSEVGTFLEAINDIQNMARMYQSTGVLEVPPSLGKKMNWFKRTWYKFINLFVECPPQGSGQSLPC